MEERKNVYLSLHKSFVREGIEYTDRATGETRTFNSATLPKGTVVDGVDVGGYEFSPMFVNESRFKGADFRDIPLLANREVWLRKTVMGPDGQPELDEGGRAVKDTVKVMPAQLKEAVDAGRSRYLAERAEHARQASRAAEPSSPTPAPGSYSTSPVPSGDVTAAIWYSFGSPGFDASMFPGSWYDGGGWDDAKYAAASHVLIAYAYSGSESAATHGTSAEFASWAKSELIGGTFAKMKAGAGKVSAGFEAFCVRTGGGSQTLVSFSWSAGGVKVAKTDSEAGAEPQGDASLDGASFSVVNETGRYVLVGGRYYADGEVCATIKTAPEDGSHVAATGADALPAGNYRIVESGAPEGYDASDVPVAFTVKAGEVRDLTGDPVTDEVFRGGVQVTKSDKELQASEALAGSGHKEAPGEHPGLDGIEFTVTNRSAHKVLVDGEWREPGEAVATLTTAWNDEAGAYTAQTAADALPYGTYDVRETATNGSYLLTDGEPRTFEVRTGGEIVSASADGAALEFRDQVVRNDLELSKKSESDNAGLMVPFAIENAATGETHVLVTDRNGDASTASSWNRHSLDFECEALLRTFRAPAPDSA